MKPEMLIAGHSHAMAMGLPVVARDARTELVSIAPRRFGLVGAWPRPADYWNTLEREARGRAVVLSWQGTEYLGKFLVAPAPLFDFVPSARPDAPLLADAQLVPESLVRSVFTRGMKDAAAMLARIVPSAAIVYVPAPPPPKDDDTLFRSRLIVEHGFHPAVERSGMDISAVAFSPPLLLLKLWELTQDLLEDVVTRAGAMYVPCPPETRDSRGLLRREYWNDDITHANSAFGDLLLASMETRS